MPQSFRCGSFVKTGLTGEFINAHNGKDNVMNDFCYKIIKLYTKLVAFLLIDSDVSLGCKLKTKRTYTHC